VWVGGWGGGGLYKREVELEANMNMCIRKKKDEGENKKGWKKEDQFSVFLLYSLISTSN
jgi:hypothetical protein